MSKLNLCIISDIHLGHPKNKAIDIIRNLKRALPNNATTGELDIIFLAGDVYDTLLTLPSEDATEIDMWISFLISICEKHNIILRILEGTPSHDWKQSERFINIATMMKSTIDVKYVKELSIEYIEKFDINVLYVPDEWRPSTEKTLNDVHELLKAKGLEKIDYAIMHGAFTFQLAEHIKTHKHNPDAYLKIVDKLIFIGHIHKYSSYDRIIAQGSFDRLQHGEEEPKGHILAYIEDDDYSVIFVENKNAKIFKTIDCTYLNLDDTIKRIDNYINSNDIPNGSFIRILADKDNPILVNMNVLVIRYPLLMWSKLVNSINEDMVIEEKDECDYVPITITNSNIKNLLLNRITFSDVNSNIIFVAEKILDEVI